MRSSKPYRAIPFAARRLLAATLVVITGAACARPPSPQALPLPQSPQPEQAAPREEAATRERSPSPRDMAPPDPRAAVACASAGRTALNADSVALRFVGAFLRVAVLPIRLSLPTSGIIHAGPADVTTPAPSRISVRATTESMDDGTAYRVEVRVAPPAKGWSPADSAVARDHAATLCTRLQGAAFP